jgi:hypothetical protein
MLTNDLSPALARVFSELVLGTDPREGYVLNRGDVGLLRSLEKLAASDASKRINGGATIAAHAQHLRYGLLLLNRWAAAGGNPFADAKWDEAWKISEVDEREWREILEGLHHESRQWLHSLESPRDVTDLELTGLFASVAHLAYHLGAIRQIDKSTRGPTEGAF